MSNGNGETRPATPDQAQAGGKVEMILFAEGGRVIQRFHHPMLFVAYEPGNAVEVGKKLIDCAVDCGARVEIKVPRRPITPLQRQRTIVRVGHVIRSLLEKGQDPKVIARNVVDTVLSAIE